VHTKTKTKTLASAG